ncbi:MAG TPA: sterol desaturase family protein [Rhizomicrobium sp.]|jgi:sterol desaturase/sphingolipid hydroxylase (fatty acid hydroxylase superfamily)|nr:sterol desaturase family protein [Rhizomicrobium sp.]
MPHFDPVQLATPAFIFLVVAEMLFAYATGRARFEARDTAASLAMGFLSVIAGTLLFFGTGDFAVRYAVTSIAWSVPAVVALFVLDDLLYYWWHRASHRVRWLWADHVQHHSSQHYNLSTALRQPLTGAFTPGFLFGVPLFVMGFPVSMLAFVHGLNLIYQFWIHTEAIGKCPAWFEAVFNTPSHHRAHHATNARYLDTNYAGVFIVWDRLFGTFVPEEEADPPRYGIVKNLATFNPVRIAAHEWVGIAGDLKRARSWRERGGYVFGPPGWSPDGSRETSETIRRNWARFHTAPSASPAE